MLCADRIEGKAVMAQQTHTALIGATILDGTGAPSLNDGVLVIHDEVIEAVGPRDAVTIPPYSKIVDVTGKTIMPGMIDCHTHLGTTTVNMMERLNTHPTVKTFLTARMMHKVLAAGFTTVRDAGGIDVGFRVAVEQGLITGPRLVVSGPLRQTGGHFDKYYASSIELSTSGFPLTDGVPAVQQQTRHLLRQGYDFIKVCTTGGIVSPTDKPTDTVWTMEELQAIVHEASARGKAVMAHAQGTQGIKNAVKAGVWSVEHGSMLDDEAVDMMLAAGTYLVPTLFPFQFMLDHGKTIGLPAYALDKLDRYSDTRIQSFQRAVAAGIKIATGSDAIHQDAHGMNARELTLMVEYGLSPLQAIVAATATAAQVCRIADRTGTLTVGKQADLLVVDGDPQADITLLEDTSRLLLIMKDGSAYIDRLMHD
jgi:imidazolonepropionase-like amidohydrolase